MNRELLEKRGKMCLWIGIGCFIVYILAELLLMAMDNTGKDEKPDIKEPVQIVAENIQIIK